MTDSVESRILKTIKALPLVMQEIAQELQEDFPAYIESEMEQSKLAAATFNAGDRLHSNTPEGGLADSFRTDSIIRVGSKGITGTFQSNKPYANIHNVGGFIASKGNMHKFFWAQYAKTKQQFYKIIALSVMKKGGVNIKKRAYFDNATAAFQSEAIPRISTDVLERVRQIFEAA